MGKLKLEVRRCVEEDGVRCREIIECGEHKIEEAHQMYSSSPTPFDFEAIDIDSIMALMECGKHYSVEELVGQFGVSADTAKSLLGPRSYIDIPSEVAESELLQATDAIFDNGDLCECAEPFSGDLPLNEITEFSDEELERMIYELKHAFD